MLVESYVSPILKVKVVVWGTPTMPTWMVHVSKSRVYESCDWLFSKKPRWSPDRPRMERWRQNGSIIIVR